jgi:hypothetical protein
MKVRPRVKRVGRYWIDRDLLNEGYRADDVFEDPLSTAELPELLEPRRPGVVYWLRCPVCEESTQVSRASPICSHCGWSQDSKHNKAPECAA